MYTLSKNWFLSYSILMVIFFMVSSSLMVTLNNPLIIHLDLTFFFSPIPTNMCLMIDKQALIFLSTVSAVSSLVIFYSFLYMKTSESNYSLKKFLLILMTFIFSMFILSTSANIFWMMIGWDGLGISSFCLIIFYQNWNSFSSGMVTFLSNRLGDSLIIISMVWILMNSSSESWMISNTIMISSLLFLAGSYSKSAQLPYLFWLPQAMAAPTPVSALVHSSTLVTAGIYSITRFSPFLNPYLSILFFFISSITVVIAGTSSLMEFDLKKIIALSTLCHISLMMMFTILGDKTNSFIHLITHAFFKSLLFMIAGYLIHSNKNSQDIRLMKASILELKVTLPFFISILSMMGIPFLSGFYSKENLLSWSFTNLPSLLMLMTFMINSFFSCAYSIRIAKFLFFSEKKILMLPLPSKCSFSTIFLTGSFFSSFAGGIIMFFILTEEPIQSPLVKSILLIFSVLGVITGMSIDKILSINMPIKKMMSDLWKSNFLYKIFQHLFFSQAFVLMWKNDEKGSIKKISSQMLMKIKELSFTPSLMTLKNPFFLIKTFHLIIIVTIMMMI